MSSPEFQRWPEYEQAIDFTVVHGFTSALHGSSTSMPRLKLIDALRRAPSWPVDFPAMSNLGFMYGKDSLALDLSPAYNSELQHELVRFDGEYATTHWGILHTLEANPYRIMRIWRQDGYGLGKESPAGLYVAQHKRGGALIHFAINEQPTTDGKFQVQRLDETVVAELAHEVWLGAEAAPELLQNRRFVIPREVIDHALSQYPHPSSYLDPVFSHSKQ